MEALGGPLEVYFATRSAYDAIESLSAKDKDALMNKSCAEASRILAACQDRGIRILTAADGDYPQRLSQLHDAPQVLYVRGHMPPLDDMPAIALVGTRKSSPYGEKMAADLGYQLAKAGAAVVTGMAKGNDAAAARGALMGGGCCVGVLGTAIDVDYPAENAALIRDAAATGCILSEFPPGSKSADFPRRNRIISGLCCGVCVVEAPAKSGALITAALALEQGRDIFAVPGNADNPNCAGSNALIREGARLVSSGAEILEEYAGLFEIDPASGRVRRPYELSESPVDKQEANDYINGERETAEEEAPKAEERPVEELFGGATPDQLALLRLLREGEKQADELIAATGFSAAKTMAELTMLTIRGLVVSRPGKRYVLKTK
ncbi:MAG: DNA-processing protein DprA [Oscillospiraceae bacterium]|nr:DNA-processing protein DprA [Oscillospiraceae bacterium]